MRIHLLAGLAAAYLITTGAMAVDYKAGTLTISDPWSRATPKGAQTAIGYMTIRNDGTSPERLVGGSIEVADHFQLHAMKMEGDVAKMNELHDIEIKPGNALSSSPEART